MQRPARVIATLLVFASAAAASAAGEGDSVTTASGVVRGRSLVLLGGKVQLESAGGIVRVKLADVTAFTVRGGRTVKLKGMSFTATGASLVGGKVIFSGTAMGAPISFDSSRVESIEFDGWRERFARVTGGFISKEGKAVAEQGFKGSLALGYASTSGTVDGSNLSVSGDAMTIRGPYRLTLNAKALITESEDLTTADTREASAKLERYLSSRSYAYGRAAGFSDEVADVRLRVNVGAGLGYMLLALDEQSLAFEGGAEYEKQRTDPEGTGAIIEEGGVWRAAFKYEWKISDKSTFTQQAEAFGALEGASEFRSRAITGLTSKIADNLSMKLAFTWDYDDVPPEGNEHSELRFESVIVISF